MKHKILELSMDAMVGEDLDYLAQKPNFSRIFRDSARVGSVTTIFPSITYPAHAGMMTGCRPGKTGIYTNFRLNVNPPKAYKDWHMEASAIQTEDFFAAAKRAGMTTAAVYWPITGNNPNIDWEINELFFYQNEDPETLFRKYGANDEAIAVVKENLAGYLRGGEKHSLRLVFRFLHHRLYVQPHPQRSAGLSDRAQLHPRQHPAPPRRLPRDGE